VKLMPFALILIGSLALLGSPIYALTIDAQPMTTCSALGFCKTIVDVSPYLTTKELDDFKISDYTKSLTALTYDKTEVAKPKEATDFIITYNGSIMTVSGNVLKGESAYWTLALTKDVLIDPWWNVTGTLYMNNTLESIELSDGGINGDDYSYRGQLVTIGSDCSRLIVEKHSTSTVPFVRMYTTPNQTNVLNATYSGIYATFNNTTAGTYYLLNNVTKGTDHMWQSDAASYTYTNGNVTAILATIRRVSGAWSNYTNYWFELESITCEIAYDGTSATWYENNLFLNGNESNITISTTTALNSTATTNLTGAYVAIWINDTLSANSTNSANNTTTFSAGLYNVTAFFGNTSTNETKTWWANITSAVSPPSSETIAYIYCTDNTTLGHINVTNLQTDSVITYYENCANGCDNTTASCSPSETEELLYTGGFAAFMLLVVIIIAWRVK